MSVFYIRDVEYNKDQIVKMKQIEMFCANITCMRTSLFKYYPNNIKTIDGVERNFSKEALINNTVFLSSPLKFDDPYDCNIYVDSKEFALQRAKYYSSLCGIVVKQEWNYADVLRKLAEYVFNHVVSSGKVSSLFDLDTSNDLVCANQKYFIISLECEMSKDDFKIDIGSEYYRKIIDNVIYKEFNDIQQTASRFRIACFAQSPYSMLMWSHYANYHQGFCIEYETPDYSDENAKIYHNLFPVIYSDTRIPLTEFSLNWKKNGSLTKDELWELYKYGLLCKSVDWKYQQEWRLISYDKLITDENYNCKFFNIKKVYLGNKMSAKDRLEIIEICKNMGIPYSGVTISPDHYNMKECSILCENCDRIKHDT